jgi:hypothetical protein
MMMISKDLGLGGKVVEMFFGSLLSELCFWVI